MPHMPPRLAEAIAHERREVVGEAQDLPGLPTLDHDPQGRLGARGPHDDPAPVAELALGAPPPPP